jgi:hypothetical protein
MRFAHNLGAQSKLSDRRSLIVGSWVPVSDQPAVTALSLAYRCFDSLISIQELAPVNVPCADLLVTLISQVRFSASDLAAYTHFELLAVCAPRLF